MSIEINGKTIFISMDEYGNVYFEFNSMISQLNVDRDNNPYADPGNYDIITMNAKINKQKLTDDIQEEPTDNDKYVDDDYIIELDSDGNEILYEDNDNPKFIFHYSNNEIEINERENGDVSALYDTDIYDLNNILILRATSEDNSSIYKLRILLNGLIYFKCMTCAEFKYKLEINENVLEIRKDNS
jgi:hypothetical protein